MYSGSGITAADVEDTRVCLLGVGDQIISASTTRCSAPFSGAACFLVADVKSDKVSLVGNVWNDSCATQIIGCWFICICLCMVPTATAAATNTITGQYFETIWVAW